MTDKDIQSLEQGLQHQIDKINNAIEKAQKNQLVDISSMDEDVASICQEIVTLEQETAAQIESKMTEMISSLEKLAVELQDYQSRTDTDNDTKE